MDKQKLFYFWEKIANFFRVILFNFTEKIVNIGQPLSRFARFVMEIIGWTLVLYFLLLFLSISLKAFFGDKIHLSNSDEILLITAVFVLAYTYETHKLKEETIFQRRIAAASDVDFRVLDYYMNDKPESTDFGELKSSATLNNVSKFSLISAFFWRPIGESTPFLRITPNSNSLVAYYDIKTKKDRVNFVRSLQLQNGGIKAAVSMTNGDRFIYTYRAAGDGWKNALVDSKSTDEFFILVRKEIDYR